MSQNLAGNREIAVSLPASEPSNKPMTCNACLGTWDFLYILEYYDKAGFCLLFYFLALLSMCMIFSSLFFGIFEEQNLNFINNLRLKEAVSTWNQLNVSTNLSMFDVGLEISERNFYIDLKVLKRDPKYNLTDLSIFKTKESYYEPHLFFFNASRQEVFKLIMGHLAFSQYEVPLGSAESICAGVKFKFKSEAKNSFDLESPITSIKNISSCSFTIGIGIQRDFGIMMTPWKEKRTVYEGCHAYDDIATAELREACKLRCSTNKGILVVENNESVCYQYDVLKEICIKVQMQNNSLYYKGGCFKNNEYSLYRSARPGYNHNFNDFMFFVREVRDPYITALDVGNITQPYIFKKAQFPEISHKLVRSGMTLVLILNIVYIALKLLHKRKYEILESSGNV